jgi:hypothetical protein
MFQSQRVGCYLNTFGGHGDDPDSKELKLVFHVNPLSYELATEVSPKLSDRLFRKNGDGEWEPVTEMPKASFSPIQIPMQNITFHELPEVTLSENSGVLVPGAAISNLRAAKAYAESRDFRLEFDVVIPMDNSTMRLIEQFYKATCFLTMIPIQRELPAEGEDPAKVELSVSLQDAADSAEETGSKRRRRKAGKDAAAGEPAEELVH